MVPRCLRLALAVGLASAVWSWALPLWAELPEELPFSHLTADHQLPSPGLQDLVQDRLGFLWLGFYSAGLARYDGQRMERYGIADGLPDLTVRALAEDARGHLWVGCETGLVVSERPLREYPTGRVHFASRFGDVDLVRTRIRRNFLAADGGGGMWVATTGEGVLSYQVDPTGKRVVRYYSTDVDADGVQELAQSLLVRRDGSVWVGLSDGTLVRFAADGGRGIVTAAESHLPTSAIEVLYESADATLWGGMQDGAVWRFSGDGSGFAIVSRTLREHARSIIDGENGEVWIGSLGDGVLRLQPASGRVWHYTRKNGMLNDTVVRLLRDQEGNIWLAQYGGISRLRRDFAAFGYLTAVSHAGEQAALPEATALAIVAPTSELPSTWIGTSGGIVGYLASGARLTLDGGSGLSSNEVYALGSDRRGRLWAGTLDGLNAVSKGRESPSALPGSRVRRLDSFGLGSRLTSFPLGAVYACKSFPLPMSAGSAATVESLWFTSTSGLAGLIGDEWLLFQRGSGLPAAGTTAVAVDADGYLWLGTHREGLLRSREPLTVARLRQLSVPAKGAREIRSPLFDPIWNRERGAPSDIVRNLVSVAGEMWVATAAGIAVLGGQPPVVRAVLDQGTGLGGDNVFSMSLSPAATLWVAQSNGLAEVDPGARRVLRTVSKAEGLIDNEAWSYGSVGVAEDGTVLLATPRGVGLYRPWLDSKNTLPPPVRLRQVSFRQDWSGDNELSVEYAALSFAAEDGVRFRTRLVGYEDQWSPETQVASLRYTNLPALLFSRSYRFEVEARNGDGVWSESPAVHRVQVRPAWWLTWWAAVGYVLAFVATVLLFNNYRTRALARLVAERTSQVRAQAEELEALDDIVEAINRNVEMRDLLAALLRQTVVLFPQADKAAFLIIDHDSEATEVVAAIGYEPERLAGISFSVDEVVNRYARSSEALSEGVYLLRSFEGRAGFDKVQHLPTPKSTLAMSVTLGGRLEGFLVLENFSAEEAFQRSDLRKLGRLRRHAVTAIAKARTLQEIRDASQAKSAFLASMSHELRTPLNSIIGFASILAARLAGKVDPKFEGFLQAIHGAGQHLLSIINDILDLAKIEAGRMEVFVEAFAFGDALEALVATMHGVAAQHGVMLETDLEQGLPDLSSDAIRVKQILYNLVSNAIKFSPPGATVVVAARRAEPSGCLRITVADQGVGMAAEDLARVFEEFQQVGAVSKRQLGTGLGLSIVKHFVALLGGSIEVTSTLGKGSTFSVLLPLDGPSAAPGIAP